MLYQVHDGTNMSAPAFFEQPYYRKGAWLRPVFASTGLSLFVKLTPRKTNPVKTEHVGFKANIWTSSSKLIDSCNEFVFMNTCT